MDRQKIVSHIWMWMLISIGIILAFYFLPDRYVFSHRNRAYLIFIFVPISIFFIYYLAGSIYYRTKYPLKRTGVKNIIHSGVYGRMMHPTCMFACVITWVLFVVFPDWRYFASAAWMTMVVFFWIKIEQDVHLEKPEAPGESAGMG